VCLGEVSLATYCPFLSLSLWHLYDFFGGGLEFSLAFIRPFPRLLSKKTLPFLGKLRPPDLNTFRSLNFFLCDPSQAVNLFLDGIFPLPLLLSRSLIQDTLSDGFHSLREDLSGFGWFESRVSSPGSIGVVTFDLFCLIQFSKISIFSDKSFCLIRFPI